MNEIEFKGYWSELDKKIWLETDWKSRDYEDLEVEGTEINSNAFFYTENNAEIHNIQFIKCIRANSTFPPYYKPVYNKELLDILENNKCMRHSMYDGRNYENYHIHDRFETQEIYNLLSS